MNGPFIFFFLLLFRAPPIWILVSYESNIFKSKLIPLEVASPSHVNNFTKILRLFRSSTYDDNWLILNPLLS